MKVPAFDRKWLWWVIFFAIEFFLLRRSLAPYSTPVDTSDEWVIRAAHEDLVAALTSTAAIFVALATWKMRWSMRPKLLRVVALILLASGLYVASYEWKLYVHYSKMLRYIRRHEQLPNPQAKKTLPKTV